MDKYQFIVVLICMVECCMFGGSLGQIEISGFRVDVEDSADPAIGSLGRQESDGATILSSGQMTRLHLFGSNLTRGGLLWFTKQKADKGSSCALLGTSESFKIMPVSSNPSAATVNVTLELLIPDTDRYYFCAGEADNNDSSGHPRAVHQGTAEWLKIAMREPYKKTYILPLWLQIIVIIILLCFSGLFSGLNLGLMALDKTELDIMINSGTESEKKFAKKIKPLRKRGNFLLCTILLGNVMVNNTLAILLDDLTGSGLAAIISATLAIVVFGEIIPQAVCSRYGLAVGARTSWFTRFFMVVTFPLSYPISRVLDCMLGEEIGNVYNRDRLRELLRLTENEMDLVKDELNIITGALQLSKKTVVDIMTKLEDVFMIEKNAVLDFETMNLIMSTGYTRIPVYEGERKNIMGILNIKDLAFVDPDDKTPLTTVLQFYKHPVNTVFEDTHLDVVLTEFKKGQSHLAVVQRVNNDGPGDPFYETIGLVTLEDIIEEIFQCEIVDESDTVYDNIKKAPRKGHVVRDFSVFNQPDQNNYTRLSPQLTLATFQFLSTSVEPFKPGKISESVLQKMLQKNVIHDLRLTDPNSEQAYLYRANKQCDYFIMILQGRVQVTFGKEKLVFEGGPFMYFGTEAMKESSLSQSNQSLTKHYSQTSLNSLDNISSSAPYIPDFTVKAVTDIQYLLFRRIHYILARRTTEREAEKSGAPGGSTLPSPTDTTTDQFDRDWTITDKALEKRTGGPVGRSESGGKSPTGSLRPGEEEPMDFTRTRDSGRRENGGPGEVSSPRVDESSALMLTRRNKSSSDEKKDEIS